ncbi:Hypothetical protein ORPV_655 [Orpheovirus IHUMI-LCC2]|uniref:Uncharacterized protein n=1 Tax=Orpheovirus IHUMI-LCC2 TaxID=2023057 RepID=A0A2I2L523_9VIRU|nr:Hypothetical protein ORPV_655 [Orpheovirus IHUMI-LCC2]SNW62559.1 Hypothetical protein ORPV_655 [Orpheovirus IHUMI-LCC2]
MSKIYIDSIEHDVSDMKVGETSVFGYVTVVKDKDGYNVYASAPGIMSSLEGAMLPLYIKRNGLTINMGGKPF